MKIGAFTMITNPDYRQDPWRESIGQMLDLFDQVVVVCGKKEDVEITRAEFPNAGSRLHLGYMEWPQPEWGYEELPKHLNRGLDAMRTLGCDWAMKFDIDTVVHENDIGTLREGIKRADRAGAWLASVEKYQFFIPTKCYEKGKMPVMVNLKKPIAYGFDFGRYTDLCQPIEWDGKQTAIMHGKDTGIPAGRKISDLLVSEVGVHAWNYDHTWKTYERDLELLYHFDRAHALFWGQGYSGKKLEEITPESAMHDFLMLSAGRCYKMIKDKKIEDHPKRFVESLRRLSYAQWGGGLWGKIVQK